jgi:DNA-binding transcriptional ArsR family regulator
MHGQEGPGGGEGQLSDLWWATLAICLLHPAQVQIIEALRCIGQPLSLRDLSEIVVDVEWVHLDYHIGRLRKLGAVNFTSLRRCDSVMDARYQLAPEGWSHGCW